MWGWRRYLTTQTLLGGGLPSPWPHTRSWCVLTKCSLARISAEWRWARSELLVHVVVSTARRPRQSRHADSMPRHTAPTHAQHSPSLLRDTAGWPARVRQKHAFQSHRLSTARTDQRSQAAVADYWCWWHLIGAVLEQPQLAAQAGQTAAHPNTKQPVIAHLDKPLG